MHDALAWYSRIRNIIFAPRLNSSRLKPLTEGDAKINRFSIYRVKFWQRRESRTKYQRILWKNGNNNFFTSILAIRCLCVRVYSILSSPRRRFVSRLVPRSLGFLSVEILVCMGIFGISREILMFGGCIYIYIHRARQSAMIFLFSKGIFKIMCNIQR